jgi:UDP-glucose 4-epimerase
MGFIGSHIVRALMSQKQDVLVFDLLTGERLLTAKGLRFPGIEEPALVQGDLCDFKEVRDAVGKNGIDKVIHTAAVSFIPDALSNPYKTFEVNFTGTLNVLEAARVYDLDRIVFISTSSVYGEIQYVPVDERHPLVPKEIYGCSKLAAEKVVDAYAKSYGLKTTIIRPTNVYGPGDLYNRVVKIFIENALSDKPLNLQGGGLQRRDFTYVEDTVSGVLAALENDRAVGEVFNISYGEDRSIREVAEVIGEFIPGTRVEVTPGRKVDIQKRRLDTSKAREVLGYNPVFNLESGVKGYIRWTVETYFPFLGLKVKNRPSF